MSPLLNDLVEEASAECLRLTAEVKEAGESLDHVVERAEALISGVVSEGERAYAGLETLAQALIDAEEELQTEIDPKAAAAFHQVMDRGQDVKAQAVELAQKVAHGVSELAEERTRIQTDLDTRMESTSQQFQRVSHAMGELEKLTAEHLQTTRTAIDALETSVDEARAGLGQAKDRLLQELDQAEAAAHTQATSYQTAIQTLLHDQTVALVGLANSMIAAHNKAVVDLRQKFAETVPATLREASDDMKVAMDGLKHIGENRTAPLEARAQAIVKVAAEAMGALERIRIAAATAGAE